MINFIQISKNNQHTQTTMTEIYTKLNPFLGLPAGAENVYWEIIETINDTEVLLHYISDKVKDLLLNKEGYTTEEIRAILNLKGVMIETDGNMRVTCKSFGYTPTIYQDSINEGLFDAEDKNVYFEIDFKNAVFQPFYDGWVGRFTKHNGVYRLSSHRKGITTNSRWGGSETFEKMFLKFYGKNTLEEVGDIMFDKTKKHSNFCHVFLNSHPDMLINSKMDIGAGGLKYLRYFLLNDNETDEDTETVSNWFETMQFMRMDGSGDNVPMPIKTVEGDTDIWMPVNFGINVANKILKDGYVEGSGEGESVICIYGEFGSMCKITPTSSKWRSNIIGNNPNHYNRYVRLLDYAYTGSEHNRKIQYEEGEEHFKYEQLFPTDDNFEDTVENRINHITKCFIMAVPLHVVENAKGFHERYINDLALLKQYIKVNIADIVDNIRNDKLKEIKQFRNNGKLNPAGKALTRIVTQALKYTSKQKNVKGYTALLHSIDVLLSKEYGASLYSLMRIPSKASTDSLKNIIPENGSTILKKVLNVSESKPIELSNVMTASQSDIDMLNLTVVPVIVTNEVKKAKNITDVKQVNAMRKKLENMKKKLELAESKLV